MPKAEDVGQGLYKGTLAAVINLPDQSYLELLAVNDKGKLAVKDTFITSFRKRNHGIRLYSLSTSSTDTTFRWLAKKKMTTDSIKAGRYTTRK